MSEPLGRGLESLIPEKGPDEVPGIFPSGGEPSEGEASPESAPLPGNEGPVSAAAPRRYEDHFVPRRDDSVFWIELEKIDPNPYQPRRDFGEEALNGLAQSIREHGVLQPILVTKREIETPTGLAVRYQLIAGERRLRAARLAGLSQIPAMIRRGVPDDRIRLELALIENVQREDLNPLERARAFRQLLDEFKLVQKEIAQRIGKSREMVANSLRLLALPPEIQEGITQNRINEGHARAILMTGDDLSLQKQLFAEVIEHRMNVREAESRARQLTGRTLVPRGRATRVLDPEMRMWETRLQEWLGTKVQLQKIGARGKIVVEFFSEEELRGLLDKLIKEV